MMEEDHHHTGELDALGRVRVLARVPGADDADSQAGLKEKRGWPSV
jgi:hypothetical protein